MADLVPDCISEAGVSIMLTDEHGRGLYVDLSTFEKPSIDVVTDAAVGTDLTCDTPLNYLGAVEAPPSFVPIQPNSRSVSVIQRQMVGF